MLKTILKAVVSLLLLGSLLSFGIKQAHQLWLHYEASSPTPAAPPHLTAANDATSPSHLSEQQANSQPPAHLALPVSKLYTETDRKAMTAIHARFATGDFITALKLADADALDPKLSDRYQDWLFAQLPALLTSAGWTRLKLGDCDEAVSYFRRAEAINRSTEGAKGLAVCHYKQKSFSAAREQFSYYLERPESEHDVSMRLLYTDVLESEGAFDEAVQILEQLAPIVTEQDPELSQQVDQRLHSMRARARESIVQQNESSRNFRLAYRAGDHEDLVAYVLQTLEDALDEFIDIYGFRLPRSPIEVSLYPAKDFKHLVAGGPEWAEGIFDGRLRIPVRREVLTSRSLSSSFSSLRTVLRHELVHALFSGMSDSRSVPPWFDEGLAQRLSCRPSCGSFQFPGGPGAFLPMPAFSTPYISFDASKAGRAYQQSLYLISVIEYNHGGDEALRRMVSHITTSSSLDSDALLKPLGLSFKDLHALGTRYWNQRVSFAPGQMRY